MRTRPWIVAAAVAALAPSIAEAADPLDALVGQFAFDWHRNPSKTRCAAVDAKLLAQFKSAAFTCDLILASDSASGKPKRVCTATSGSREYLIFATKRDCEEERKTQEANGD
jgi:hypothetical protein